MLYLVSLSSAFIRFGDDGGGFGRGGGPLWMLPIMMFFGIAFVALFLWAVYALVRHFYRTEVVPRKYGAPTALEILQRRYAAGEVSAEEYEKVRSVITRA
jgi:putative membrane protein